MVLANYHEGTWAAVSLNHFSKITIPKVCLGYERKAYADPWRVNCHWGVSLDTVFDFIAIPDPSLTRYDSRVCKLPRLIIRYDAKPRTVNTESPVITTFGFQTAAKLLEVIAAQVNKEFKSGTLRIRHSKGDHVPEYQQTQTESILSSIRRQLNPNISLETYTDFMDSDEELIDWLNESDLNVFIYSIERDFFEYGNLPAAPDTAIAAQRPLLVSQGICTTHIMKYISPFPMVSFREAMLTNLDGVRTMYQEWSPENFKDTFDRFILGIMEK